MLNNSRLRLLWIIQPNIRMRAWHHSVSACARLCVSRPESKIAKITQHVCEDRSIIFFFFLIRIPILHQRLLLFHPLRLLPSFTTATNSHLPSLWKEKLTWNVWTPIQPTSLFCRPFVPFRRLLTSFRISRYALFFSFFYLNYKSARANVVRMRRCAVLLINNTHTPSLSNAAAAAAAASLLPAVVTEARHMSSKLGVHLNHLLNAWPSPQATKPLCPTSCFPSCFGSFKQRLSVLVSRMGSTFVSAYAPVSRMCVEGRKMLANIQELNSLVGVEGVGRCVFVRVCVDDFPHA